MDLNKYISVFNFNFQRVVFIGQKSSSSKVLEITLTEKRCISIATFKSGNHFVVGIHRDSKTELEGKGLKLHMKLVKVGNIEIENNKKYSSYRQVADLLQTVVLPIKMSFVDITDVC